MWSLENCQVLLKCQVSHHCWVVCSKWPMPHFEFKSCGTLLKGSNHHVSLENNVTLPEWPSLAFLVYGTHY